MVWYGILTENISEAANRKWPIENRMVTLKGQTCDPMR